MLVGGAGKLVFKENNVRWTVTAEPRFSDDKTKKVFLGLNYHVDDHPVPSLEEVAASLLEAWKQGL